MPELKAEKLEALLAKDKSIFKVTRQNLQEQIEKCSKFEVKGWQSSGQLESAANCRLGPCRNWFPNYEKYFTAVMSWIYKSTGHLKSPS